MKKVLALLVMISVVYGVSVQAEYKYINKLPKGHWLRDCEGSELVNEYPEMKTVCDDVENQFIFYAQALRRDINDQLKEDIKKEFNNQKELELFLQSTQWQNIKNTLIQEEVRRATAGADVSSKKKKQMNDVTCFLLNEITQEEFAQFEKDMISAKK